MMNRGNAGIVKSVAIVAGLVTLIGGAIYPVIIDPKINPDKYREKQRIIRDSIPLRDTQPGGDYTLVTQYRYIIIYCIAWADI
jgi:hypothetical protein